MCANEVIAAEAKVSCIEVRVDGEWGTFFVKEYPIVPRENGKGVIAKATWTAESSYGVYGYHWSGMGQPFGDFIAQMNDGYLLGKIGKQVLNDELTIREIKKYVRECRREKHINAETARDAYEAIDSIAADYEGDVLCSHLMCASELSFICDWHFAVQEYEGNVQQFAKRLWPEFVKQFNAARAA